MNKTEFAETFLLPKRKQEFQGKDHFAFFLGAGVGISFRILGVLTVSELLLLFIVLFFPKREPWSPRLKTLLTLVLIWIVGAVIANICNQVSFLDFIKGCVSKCWVVIDIIGLYIILHNAPVRILYFLCGGILSALLLLLVPQFNIHAMDTAASGMDIYDNYYNVWIIYLYQPIALGLVCLLFYRGFRSLAALGILGFAFLTLFYLSRNIFLCWSIVFIFILIHLNMQTPFFSLWRKIFLCIILLLAFWAVKETYSYMARNQYLGERAYQKYVMQTMDSKLGLVMGRVDFFMSLMAISENPIIGYGDYARDKTLIRPRFFQYLGLEYQSSKPDLRQNFLPGHSHILGAWVYSGILGLFFWIYVGYLIYRFLTRYAWLNNRLLCVNLILIIPFIWDYLFSPFGGRFSPLLNIVYMVIYMDYYDQLIRAKTMTETGINQV